MKHKNSLLLQGLFLWLFATGLCAANGTAPTVLATSKPLHSLAAAVTHGVSDAQLLIKGNASPHLFQLRPSHVKALANADVVVWAGIGVERFIPDALENLAPDAISLELATIPDMVLHKARGDHEHPVENDADPNTVKVTEINHGDQNDHVSDNPHDVIGIDYHIWLDPHNAIVAVNMLAKELSKLDPDHADIYRLNAADFSAQLVALRSEIDQLMLRSQGKSYLVYHDSIQYFEKAFGLGEALVVTRQPQVQAGGRRLKLLRQQVADNSPGCIFAEVQFRALSLQVLADDLNLKTATIDPLASDFSIGPGLYSEWLLQTANQIADCLQ